MDWKKIHDTSTVVDWHNHAALKKSLFNRNIGSKRNTFPQMEEGGMDVILSTNYIPETEWKDDISLIKWLLRFSPDLRKKIFDPTYFDATLTMMDGMEEEA